MRLLIPVSAVLRKGLSAKCIPASLLSSAFLVLLGCSSLLPSPQADPQTVATFNIARTLPNAVAVAESLRTKYLERAGAQRREERVAGLALVGMGVVAADLALRGVGTNEALGLGLAGAGLYTANGWVNMRTDRAIYVEGAAALQCALLATQSLQTAYTRRGDLNTNIGVLQTQSASLDRQLEAFAASSSAVLRARNASNRAKALIPVARAALAQLDQAGGNLYSVVGKVEVEVERALQTAAPDFNLLVASLINQKLLAPYSFTGTVEATADDTKLVGALNSATSNLEVVITDTQNIVDLVNTTPSAAELQHCSVDVTAAGIAMKVEPSALIVAAETTGVVLASGGVPGYSVSWFGAAPPTDQVTVKAELNGVISIEAKSTAQAGTYSLLVVDSAKGRTTLLVTLAPKGTSAPAPVQRQQNADASSCVSIPRVKVVQAALIKRGTTSVTIDGTETTVLEDGCEGPITDTAMTKYLQEMKQNPMPTEREALLEATEAWLAQGESNGQP